MESFIILYKVHFLKLESFLRVASPHSDCIQSFDSLPNIKLCAFFSRYRQTDMEIQQRYLVSENDAVEQESKGTGNPYVKFLQS